MDVVGPKFQKPSIYGVQIHFPSQLPLLCILSLMMKISDISVLEFYEYIDGYFYINIDISKNNKNTLKFMKYFLKV